MKNETLLFRRYLQVCGYTAWAKLLAILAFLVLSTAAFGEQFECRAPGKDTTAPILVVASVNDDRESGEISVAKVQYETGYLVNGFDRYWVWGDLDGEPEFMFRIQPDGTGHYFELPNTLLPAQQFKCTEH